MPMQCATKFMNSKHCVLPSVSSYPIVSFGRETLQSSVDRPMICATADHYSKMQFSVPRGE